MGNKAKKRSGELNNELIEGGVPSETMEKVKIQIKIKMK